MVVQPVRAEVHVHVELIEGLLEGGVVAHTRANLDEPAALLLNVVPMMPDVGQVRFCQCWSAEMAQSRHTVHL